MDIPRSTLKALMIAVALIGSLVSVSHAAARYVHASSGCSTSIIDWVNFVELRGITYRGDEFGQHVQPYDLGPQYETVHFKVADNVCDPEYRLKDGDAAFLEAGTPIYSLKHYKTWFRVAAWQHGTLTAFEVTDRPGAKKGAGLLDIRSKVRYIAVYSATDGRTRLGSIRDSAQVKALVRLVLQGSVAGTCTQSVGRYVIAFHLKDGTTVTRDYSPATGCLRTIRVARAFGDAVDKAVRAHH